MSADDRFWDRDELYKEVWATPMQVLAKKYGISDVGLAKVCRKLGIPRPGRGYWARKEAGQEVKQVPLPLAKEKVNVEKPSPRPAPPNPSDLATPLELAQLKRLEQTNGETLLRRGTSSHPLVAQTRLLLTGARVDDRKILWTPETCLDIRVSKGSLSRALRIMAALLCAIEDAGFSVSIETSQKHRTVAKIHGEEVTFGLTEKVDRVEIATPPKGGLLDRVLTFGGKPVTLEPSGKLTIEVWSAWGADQKRWKDGKSKQLEEQLPQVVAGFIRIALTERAEREKRVSEARERQKRIEDQARLEEKVRAEQVRVRALSHAAEQWSRAQQLRSFISAARDAAIQNGQRVDRGSPLSDWIVWAEQQADRFDPLKEGPRSVIDRAVEPQRPSYYSSQEPETHFRFPKPIWKMT